LLVRLLIATHEIIFPRFGFIIEVMTPERIPIAINAPRHEWLMNSIATAENNATADVTFNDGCAVGQGFGGSQTEHFLAPLLVVVVGMIAV
jgi:hypothetical protein